MPEVREQLYYEQKQCDKNNNQNCVKSESRHIINLFQPKAETDFLPLAVDLFLPLGEPDAAVALFDQKKVERRGVVDIGAEFGSARSHHGKRSAVKPANGILLDPER